MKIPNNNNNKSLNIFLVDDDEDDAMLFTEAISEIHPGATVKVFNEWNTVIPFIESSSVKPDIIFLDYILPGKRGNELAHELRQNPILKNVPLVLCSGLTEPLKTEESQHTHFQQMIRKPSTFEKLVDILRNVLTRNTSLSVS